MGGIGPVGSAGGMSAVYLRAQYAAHLTAARSAAANPAQPEKPVEPVSAVRQTAPDTPVRLPIAVGERRLPTVDDLNNASENLARMRMQYAGETAQAEPQADEKHDFNTFLMNAAGIS